MSYTKLELVKGALTEIGMGSYLFDLASDQLDAALARLDAMMAEWNGRGIRLNYPIANSPAELEGGDASGIPDYAVEAVITNLAIRLAPAYGKGVSIDTKATATRGMSTLYAKAAKPKPIRLGVILAGAGAKSSIPFLPEQEDEVVRKVEDSIEFE